MDRGLKVLLGETAKQRGPVKLLAVLGGLNTLLAALCAWKAYWDFVKLGTFDYEAAERHGYTGYFFARPAWTMVLLTILFLSVGLALIALARWLVRRADREQSRPRISSTPPRTE